MYYLGTLLHETAHAAFHFLGFPMDRRYFVEGTDGHGYAWKDIAPDLESFAREVLGLPDIMLGI